MQKALLEGFLSTISVRSQYISLRKSTENHEVLYWETLSAERSCHQLLPSAWTVNQKIDCPEEVLLSTNINSDSEYIFSISNINLITSQGLIISSPCADYRSTIPRKAKLQNTLYPWQRGQGATSHEWSSQMWGQPTLPSLGGEFPDTTTFEELWDNFKHSSISVSKKQRVKSGQVWKSGRFPGASAAEEDEAETCGEQRGLSFLPRLAGESQSFAGTGWTQSPALAALLAAGPANPALGSDHPVPLSLFPQMDWWALGPLFSWQQNSIGLQSWEALDWSKCRALCYLTWIFTISTPYTHRETLNLLQTLITQKTNQLSCRFSAATSGGEKLCVTLRRFKQTAKNC